MLNDHGRTIESATLAQPVELFGLSGTPRVGERLLVMQDERRAREIAEARQQRRRLVELGMTRHVSLEGLHERIAEGEMKELHTILKADVHGSIEAISQSLEKLTTSQRHCDRANAAVSASGVSPRSNRSMAIVNVR